MKSEIKKKSKLNKEFKFPCLLSYMEEGSKEVSLVVLASKWTDSIGTTFTGTVVYSNKLTIKIGKQATDWVKFEFEEFNETISLSN